MVCPVVNTGFVGIRLLAFDFDKTLDSKLRNLIPTHKTKVVEDNRSFL